MTEPNVFCCAMRRKFLVAVVAEDPDLPTPVDVMDYADFDQRAPSGLPVIRIKFCPFCGKEILRGPLRVADPGEPE